LKLRSIGGGRALLQRSLPEVERRWEKDPPACGETCGRMPEGSLAEYQAKD
jgi:hypothetical protein